MNIDIGSCAAFFARPSAYLVYLIFDHGWRDLIQEFKHSTFIAALMSTEAQLAMDGRSAAIRCAAIIADRH
jgi:hypothetical protein